MKHLIQRYYFYISANFLFLKKKYKSAAYFYSKIIKSRPNFFNVQEKLGQCFIRSNLKKNGVLIVKGGAGDFLKSLAFMINNKDLNYIVVTHFRGAELFYSSLGIKINRFYFFNDQDERAMIDKELLAIANLYPCPQSDFLDPVFFSDPNPLPNKKTVGIHIGGSQFAVNEQIKHGVLTKNLTPDFLYALLDFLDEKDFNLILFGTQDEMSALNLTKYKNLILANSPDILKNLTYVKHCNLLIGSDSVFKTMSSMLKIPTVVLLANVKDGYRDRVFIEPYVKSNIMKVIKFNDLMKASIDALIGELDKEVKRLVG